MTWTSLATLDSLFEPTYPRGANAVEGARQTARIVVIRFPDGSKEFWFPDSTLEPGDVVWHDGEQYVIESMTWDGLRGVATAGPDVEAHVKDPRAD